MKGSVRSQKLVVLDGSLFSCYSKDGRCYIACRTDNVDAQAAAGPFRLES